MRFTSKYWRTALQLHEEKERLWGNDRKRRERDYQVRGFYNGKALQTEEEAVRDDSAGITNHLIGYRNLQRQCDAVFAIYSTTDNLIEVKVETGNPEVDIETGARITKKINDAIYHSGELEGWFSSFSGESGINGKGPSMFGQHGWCPKMAPNVLVPENASGVAGKIPYVFTPHELSMAVLTDLEKSVPEGKEGRLIDLKMVKALKELLKRQIQGEGINQSSMAARENPDNPLEDGIRDDTRTTLKAWKYFEVYYHDKKKTCVVSETTFTDRINLTEKTPGVDGDPVVIAHNPVAYESPSHWFHPMIVDSQIGGLKTFSASRGIAELTFNSDVHAEELFNEMIEGEMIRARPKFKLLPNHNRQAVDAWNVSRSSVMPDGVEPAQVYQGGNLAGILGLLTQNTAGLTGGSFSNSGKENGELRQQAVERQSQSRSMENNRMSAIYTSLDRLVEEIVRRFLLVESKPGTDGYEDIAWFRDCMDEYNIPYKKLGEMKHGRFKYLKVRVARSIGNGDRESEIAVATLLMANIEHFEPEVRPLIRRKWVTLTTRDPDLASQLSTLPTLVINAQKLVAENEFDTILRRATIGQELPVGADDIDEDHMPVHLLDGQAFLSESAFRPFTELDARRWAGAVDHMVKHVSRMLSVPASAGAGKAFQGQLQQLVREATPIFQKVQEDMQQNAMSLSPQEQLDVMFKTQEQMLKGRKLGLEEAKFGANETQRRQRERRADRQQYAAEVQNEKSNQVTRTKLALDQKNAREKLDLEKQKVEDARKAKSAKPKSSSSSG